MISSSESCQRMAESESGPGLATSIQLPFNSKRLTANYLRRLTTEVGVPTSTSVTELRQMIDGKLSEDGRDMLNVQVVLLIQIVSSPLKTKMAIS